MCKAAFSNELFAFSKAGKFRKKLTLKTHTKMTSAIITEKNTTARIVVDQDVDTESKLLTSGLGLKRALNDSTFRPGDRFFQLGRFGLF